MMFEDGATLDMTVPVKMDEAGVAQSRLVTLQVHHFSSTGEAYDACQCDTRIRNGDILIVKDEQVVGVADAWPVAVTRHQGKLHGIKVGEGTSAIVAARALSRRRKSIQPSPAFRAPPSL